MERAHFPTFGSKAKNHYDPNEGFSAYLAYDYRTRKDWPKTDQAESFLGQSASPSIDFRKSVLPEAKYTRSIGVLLSICLEYL